MKVKVQCSQCDFQIECELEKGASLTPKGLESMARFFGFKILDNSYLCEACQKKTGGRKMNARITWTLTEGEKPVSHVKIEAGGAEVFVGIKAIVTEAARAFAKELGAPEAGIRRAICEFANKEENNE